MLLRYSDLHNGQGYLMAAFSYILTFHGYYKLFDNITTKPGVYCLYSQGLGKSGGNERELLYIGATTGSLRDRITDHFYDGAWSELLDSNKSLCASAATHPFETGELYGLKIESELTRVEAAMIYHHRPPHNKMYKDNFPFPTIEITLKGDCDQLDREFRIAG